jgi:GT2 family glycosyltransferase
VRREAWDAAGGFDAGYFMYGEDLDLSLRLRLAGWEIGLARGAEVEHEYAFAKGTQKWFLLERNRWLTVLGAYPRPLLAALLPALLAAELAFFLAALRGGWLGAKARASLAVLRGLPDALRRRAAVQAAATVSPREFAASLTAGLDSPFLGPVAGVRPLAAAQAAYWRAVQTTLR